MCGISGIFDYREKRRIDESLLRRMNDTVSHRGPDDFGTHVEPGVGLGHRRLSIIDLAGGKQPIYNTDGTVAITFNGEIYNYQELRAELRQLGCIFATDSDTEVIVHGWQVWGPECVSRLNGMFAFVIWDRNQDCVFAARDRIGIKPFYYACTADDFFLFGSELKVLLEHPGLERNIMPGAVEDYFTFGYVPEPYTILKNVFKLPPGHTLLVRRGQSVPEPRQYWDISFAPHGNYRVADAEAEIIERLQESVRLRMIADVPLGAFLSGGVDSSAIVAMMSQLSDAPVRTCSISFGDPEFNEARYADQVAKHLQTQHYVEQVDPEDFDLIDHLSYLYDEPYADSSAMPTYRVCELARKQVKVALSGDGGDENFAGYRRYRWHMYEEKVRRRLPQGVRGPLFGTLGRLYPKLDWAPQVLRAKSTLEALGRDSLAGYLHSVSIFPTGLRQRLFSDAFKRELAGYQSIEHFRRYAADAPTDDGLSLVQYLDFKTYLPGDILTKVDRTSMAQGLEVRVPLLDHTFVDWVSGLRPGDKLHGREGKHIFKTSLEQLLPHDILYRPKMGFAVPIGSWFRGPLKDKVAHVLGGEGLADSGFFDVDQLRKIGQDHFSGKSDYTAIIWALLMFDGFHNRVMRGDDARAAA
ncbi:MAG: amidotransferase 1, exosortase A system-associated [Gammaproteobacteria bacterium]|nr:amidotransferase 1, exosortase A system-associated [Gammaproteobacteria bacterium]